MLITDKNNRSYAFITLEDVMEVMANTKDKKAIDELKILYNSEEYNELGKIRISKESEIYKLVKNTKSIINGDEYITPSMLSDAFTRAAISFNYEMRDRIFKYLKKYLDNVKENRDNDNLIQKILCDKKLMEYIQKYDTFEDYTKHLIENRISKKKNNVIKEETKNKSYVMIN